MCCDGKPANLCCKFVDISPRIKQYCNLAWLNNQGIAHVDAMPSRDLVK